MPQMHKTIREMLPDYLSGTLDAAHRGWVESHLAGCVDCRRELVEWQSLAARLGLELSARAVAVPAWRAPDLPVDPPQGPIAGPPIATPTAPAAGAWARQLSPASRRAAVVIGFFLIVGLSGLLGLFGRFGQLELVGGLDRAAERLGWARDEDRDAGRKPKRGPGNSDGEGSAPRFDDASAGIAANSAGGAIGAITTGKTGALPTPVLRALRPVLRASGPEPAASGTPVAPSNLRGLVGLGRVTPRAATESDPRPSATAGPALATPGPTPAPDPDLGAGADPPGRPTATENPIRRLRPPSPTPAPPTPTSLPSETSLPVAGRVSGRVRGPDGLPRAEIAVIADRLDAPAEPVPAVTGIDGVYVLELDPGRWILHAETPAYQLMWHAGKANPRSANPVDVELGSSMTADFYLESNPPARLRGRVSDAAGRPLSRALVLVAFLPDQPGESPRLVWSSFTDVSGDYQLYLPPGTWFLAAAPDWRSERLTWWGGNGQLEEAERLGLDADSNAQADITLRP